MLPRPDGLGTAYPQRFIAQRCVHEVRYEAVVRPVSPADDVTGAGRGKAWRVRAIRAAPEERASIRTSHEFGTSLAAAVRIVPAHGVAFPITFVLLPVLVALVAGDIDQSAGSVAGASAYPETFAPIARSHSTSQLPLNPVCPVTRTRLPAQKSRVITRSSRAANRLPRALRDGS